MLKNFTRLTLLAACLAWIFDQLFWGKSPGISFPIFVVLLLVAGFLLAWAEGVRPARASLLLLVPIGFFAAMSVFRLEPFTQLLNYALSLGSMLLLVVTFVGGRWLAYGIADYFINVLLLLPSMAVLPLMTMERQAREHKAEEAPRSVASQLRPLLGVLRGLLLALPVLTFFTALLASADAAFSAQVTNLLKIFDLDKVPEYIFRLFYIAVLTYLLISIYLHALLRSREEKVSDGANGPGTLLRFLPHLEASIVLGSVVALFAAFVAVQVRYFFGGQANINLAGFTYAEYARRGFNELLAVAFFSLVLFVGLSSFTRRDSPGQRWSFSVLGTGLAMLVTVILISAFQRLALYEQVYGFTRLRTYTHVFIIWLGLLLLTVVVLEWLGRMRHFALSVLCVALGFAISIGLLNVDALIVRLNVAHGTALLTVHQAGSERMAAGFDAVYLATLSDDAIPALLAAFHRPDLDPALHDELGAILACKAAVLADRPQRPWQSFHWSSFAAESLLRAEADALKAYPVLREWNYQVEVNGKQRPCFEYGRDF
ncbi:MAG: DUF4153 domain-containing protein [Chloroflexota bacterium]